MATKDSPSGKDLSFEFPGSDRNVYAEYLRATFVRRDIFRFACMTAILLVTVPFSAYVLLYPDLFSYEAWIRVVGWTPRSSMQGRLLIPTSVLVLVMAIPAFAVFSVPLTPGGCGAGNFFWPRLYWSICSKHGLEGYKRSIEPYFDSFERYPTQALVGDKSVRVSEPDGKSWTLAFRNVRRAYRGKGLVVLESGAKLPSSRTVILDVSGMDRSERGRFYRFLDKRLPVDSHCKTYYMRWTGPAVGEVVPDDEAPRSGGDTEKER